MFTVFLLRIFGFMAAIMPEFLARWICNRVGDAVLLLSPKRRRVTYSNLHHAFPDKPDAWIKKMGRLNSRRMIELFLFALAAPFLTKRRIKKIFTASAETRQQIRHFAEQHPSGIALVPHVTMMETLVQMPVICKELELVGRIGNIFRPLDNPHLDAWIKQTRERFGMELLSRKEGFAQGMGILREGGWLSILYDQNAGNSGALITLFDRVASATDLPGMLAKKYKVPTLMVWSERTAFWRAELKIQPVETKRELIPVTVESNLWLEEYLKSSEDRLVQWFWGHSRWKTQDRPRRRFHLSQKKSYIDASLALKGQATCPRTFRAWVRLPNWLGDVVMVIPLLRALERSRPDIELTLLARPQFLPLLEEMKLGHQLIALPPKGKGYYRFFRDLHTRYPDTWVLFTNSLRGDLEAWLAGCPQRFGIQRPNKKRPLLTHSWKLPEELKEAEVHQSHLWHDYLKEFGLLEEPDYSPLSGFTERHPEVPQEAIVFICGTENSPEKRWPIEFWRHLISLMRSKERRLPVVLLGTANDREITSRVAQGHENEGVINLAGKTSLPEFARALKSSRAVICNDTGGMHLANALGVPVVGIFGPTNPVRTGPVFDSQRIIMQPPGCPPTGGQDIAGVSAEMVLERLLEEKIIKESSF